MRKRLRRALRWLGGLLATLLAALVGLVVGVAVWIVTPSGNDFVREQLETWAPTLLADGQLSVGHLETDFSEGLVLEDVALTGPGNREVIAVERLSAEFRLRRLIKGELPISSIRIEGPALDVQVDRDGVSDLTRIFGAAEEDDDGAPSEPWGGLPIKIQIGLLELSGGRVLWATPDQRWEVEDLGLSLAAAGKGREVRADKIALSGRLASHQDLELGLAGGVGFLDGDVELKPTTLSLGGSRLSAAGRLEDVETELVADLVLDVQGLETGDLEQLLGDLGLSGGLAGELKVHGPMTDMSVDGRVRLPEGQLGVSLGADLAAEELTWRVGLKPEGLQLMGFVDAVTEPVSLSGSLDLTGGGAAWPDEVYGRGTLTLEEPVVWGYLLVDTRTELEIRDGELLLKNTTLSTPWAQITGSGALGAEGVSLDLLADVADLGGLSEFGVEGLGGATRLAGELSVDWSGEFTDIFFAGRVNGARVLLPGNVLVGDVSGPLVVRVDGAGTRASGEILATEVGVGAMFIHELSSPWRVDVTGDGVAIFSLEPAVRSLDIAELPITRLASGTLEGKVGAGGDVNAQLDLGFEGVIPETYNWGGGGLKASMDGDLVAMELTIEDSEDNVFVFLGDMNTSTLDVNIQELQFAPDTGARWRSRSRSSVAVLDDGVVVDGLAFESEAGTLEVSGRMVTAGELDAKIRLDDFDLDWLARFVPSVAAGWEGRIDLNLDLGGTGGDPEIDGMLKLAGVKLADAATGEALVRKLTGQLDIVGRQGGVSVQGHLGLPKKRMLGLSGRLPMVLDFEKPELLTDQPLALDLLLLPSESEELTTLIPALPTLAGMQASAQLQAAGTARAPEVRLSWSATLPLGGEVPAVSLDGELRYADGALTADAEGRENGRRLVQIDGGVATDLPAVIAWYLDGEGQEPDLAAADTWVNEMDLRVVPMGVPLRTLASVADLGMDVEGQLAGGLAVRGSPLDPKIYAGFLVTGGRLAKVDFALPMFSLTPVLGGYQFDGRFTFQDPGAEEPGELSITAYVPLDLRGGTVDLDEQLARDSLLVQLSGQGIPVAILSAFDPSIRDASGTFAINDKRHQITGSVSAPEPDLELMLRDGAFDYGPAGIRVADLNLDLWVTDQRLRLRHFTMDTVPLISRTPEQDKGTLSGEITVAMDDWSPGAVSGSVDAERVWVSSRQDFTVQLSGDVSFSGTWPVVEVDGDIAMNKAVLTLGETFWLGEQTLKLEPTLAIARSGEVARAARPEEPAFWEQWDIGVQVYLPPQSTRLDVKMPMESGYGKVSAALSTVELDTWLEGDLGVAMARAGMSINGTVETRRGEATVFGKDFDLETGEIRFGGAAYDDPILDIEAVHHTNKYGDITATIRDSVSDLDLGFTSSEDWSDTDIASILLIGLPSSELSQSQGGSGASLVTAALAMMSSAAADAGVMGGLDLLEVETGDNAEGGASIGSIRAGRALSDKLFLIVGLDFEADENENVTEATVEWLISRQIFAEFVTGDAGESSADVYTRWRF